MKRVIGLSLFAVAFGSVGCSTTHPNTAAGTGIGAALGAGTGLAVGAATGNPKTGAAVGGLIGAGLGGALGAEADERDRERSTQVAVAQAQAQAAQTQMGMTDVVELCKSGAAPQVVINQIRGTGSRFNLSTADIQYLTANDVPQDVIAAMQQAQGPPSKVIYRTPPQTVIYESYPYAPVYVAPRPVYVRPTFGVMYSRHW